MIKLFFVFLCIPFFLFAKIIDNSGTPTKSIIDIFKVFSPISDQVSLEELNSIAQASFLRKAGQERWEDKRSFDGINIPKLKSLFQEIGSIGHILPKSKEYDYILINGSTIGNMRERVNTLIRLVKNQNILISNKTKIVFLTGERSLTPSEQAESGFDNENQGALWVWKNADLPDALKKINIEFILGTKKTGAIRATTHDTVDAWMATNPTPGKCLSISSQPFVYYQEITMKNALKSSPEFFIEGVGFDYDDESYFQNHISIYLDNLARTIYTLVQMNAAPLK